MFVLVLLLGPLLVVPFIMFLCFKTTEDQRGHQAVPSQPETDVMDTQGMDTQGGTVMEETVEPDVGGLALSTERQDTMRPTQRTGGSPKSKWEQPETRYEQDKTTYGDMTTRMTKTLQLPTVIGDRKGFDPGPQAQTKRRPYETQIDNRTGRIQTNRADPYGTLASAFPKAPTQPPMDAYGTIGAASYKIEDPTQATGNGYGTITDIQSTTKAKPGRDQSKAQSTRPESTARGGKKEQKAPSRQPAVDGRGFLGPGADKVAIGTHAAMLYETLPAEPAPMPEES